MHDLTGMEIARTGKLQSISIMMRMLVSFAGVGFGGSSCVSVEPMVAGQKLLLFSTRPVFTFKVQKGMNTLLRLLQTFYM